MTIRHLQPSDQEALWNWLHLALWDPPPAGLRPREVLNNPAVAIYAEGWGREGDLGVVCVIDAKDVGACWMRRIRGGLGLGYVDDDTPQLGIALLPEYRGRGLGRLLMVSALEAAAAAGYAQVSLTVHPQNPAINLYRSVGFEQKGVRNTYLLMVAPTRNRSIFEGTGFRAIEMHADDVPRLAAFFAANPAYHLAISGAPASPGAAQEEFDSLPPPDFPFRRKWMLLFEDQSGGVVGMADLLQDLFATGIWHVGTFIAATHLHGTGRPREMYDAMERWLASQGARWLRLGVVEANPRGVAFWRRVGYSLRRVREGFELGGRTHRLHVMAKPLGEADWDWYLQSVPRDKPG